MTTIPRWRHGSAGRSGCLGDGRPLRHLPRRCTGRGGVGGSHGIVTAAEVGTLAPGRVVEMACAADHPAAEAVLIPDTAMHTLFILDDLEQAVGKPVLTANQVTVWKGLDLAGAAAEPSACAVVHPLRGGWQARLVRKADLVVTTGSSRTAECAEKPDGCQDR